MGHVKKKKPRNLNFSCLMCPSASFAIQFEVLYHVIVQLQRAHLKSLDQLLPELYSTQSYYQYLSLGFIKCDIKFSYAYDNFRISSIFVSILKGKDIIVHTCFNTSFLATYFEFNESTS